MYIFLYNFNIFVHIYVWDDRPFHFLKGIAFVPLNFLTSINHLFSLLNKYPLTVHKTDRVSNVYRNCDKFSVLRKLVFSRNMSMSKPI